MITKRIWLQINRRIIQVILKIKKIIQNNNELYFLFFKIRVLFYTWHFGRLKESQYPQALKDWYFSRTGERLDLDNPKTFNEKLQWLKLNDNSPLKTLLADKYRVRQWVAEQIGDEYLIPIIDVWSNADEIDFDKLPNQFVLKTNHGCGWNIIVRSKNELNIKKARKQLAYLLKINQAFYGLELHYKNISPLIIAEKYMENYDNDLFDYKFLCFDGKPEYCWVDTDRHTDHKRSFFDLEFNMTAFTINTYPPTKHISKPMNYDKMIQLAEVLCQGFKHVRVDFYNINGKIYFGEMTFISESGITKINPPEYAIKLGDMIKLP